MKKNTGFFIWIVLLAVGLLFSITITRVATQGLIVRLSRGNSQAAATMTMNNRLQEMVNFSFELETKMLKGVSASPVHTQGGIKDSLARLEYNVGILKKFWADTVQNATLSKLVGFVNRQVHLSFNMLDAIEKNDKELQERNTDSLRISHLGDSIYTTALHFQKEVEKNLNDTLYSNNNAVAQLSWLNRLLVLVSLLSILILATIIIRRQVRQLSLIKDLEKARKTALQSAAAKDQFLANMSHEIRTPLNAIKGFGKILLQTPLNRDQQKYASIISTASENLLNIVNDILDFSKIETGNLVMKKTVFELIRLLEEIQLMFTPLAQEKDLQLTFTTGQPLPEFVKTDPVRLRQILVNLLSNAIKFTSTGSVNLHVKQADHKGKRVKLRFIVSDTGVGIPGHKINLIFERFEQLDDSFTRQQGGTGLGLAITKHLVEAMGGTIAVQSEVNKGSVFTVELELERIMQDLHGQTIQQSPGMAKPNLVNARVLIAEDNRMNQLLVKSMLERYQVETDITENGEEAIQAIKEKQYDLVLMDVQMPKADGLTATRIIREKLDTITPIIAMTAHVLSGEKEKCLAAGMNDYLAKPLDESELIEMLKKYFPVQQKEHTGQLSDNRIQWLNYEYLSSICKNDEDKVRSIIGELARQLPAERTKMEKIISRKNVTALEQHRHYLKSTLSCFKQGTPPVIILEELGKMIQLRANEEILWAKAAELVKLLDHVSVLLSAKHTMIAEGEKQVNTVH